MIGRTNVIFSSGGGSGGSGGVTTVDLPTCPASITPSPRNGKVTLSLTYSDTDFVSGVEVRYKTGSYPTSPTDGDGVTAEGVATSIEVTGLNNGTTYYFRVYLYREIDGVKYYQTDETNAKISAMPNSVWIEGITPVEVGDNYIVIDESGTFTLNTPINVTVYLVGGGYNGNSGYSDSEDEAGGTGGSGGYVFSQTLSDVTNDTSIVCTIGAIQGGQTTLQIGNITISSRSGTRLPGGKGAYYSPSKKAPIKGTNGILTPYGYVGSSGGGGGVAFGSDTPYYSGAVGGEGAGKGGTRSEGYPATNYGCGGGGGYHKGGLSENNYKGGAGMSGCVIIAW